MKLSDRDQAVNKKAEQLFEQLFRIRSELKQLEVIRTNKLAHSEYAEWFVAKLMNGNVATSTVQQGYDVDATWEGKEVRVEVKSRIVKDLSSYTAFHVSLGDIKCDYLACVFLTQQYRVLGVFIMRYTDLIKVGTVDNVKKRISLIWAAKNHTIYEPYIDWIWKRDGRI